MQRQPILTIDAHLDLAWNALTYERDLLRSVHTIRQLEAPMTGKSRAMGTVALPEMRAGSVFLSVATLLARASGRPAPGIEYGSVPQAHAIAKGQLAYYRALEAAGHVRVIESARQLKQHERDWRKPNAAATLPLGFIISMEGADPITHAQ